MKKIIKISLLGLAATLFAGVLLNTSPINVNAEDDFIVDLHNKTFLKVEVGENFTVALSTENEVFTFGRNNLGQLGIGTLESTLEVNNITASFNLVDGENIVDIEAGRNFTIAATNNNRIFTWGDNAFAQLGNGTTTTATSPIDVTSNFAGAGATIKKIVAGDTNSLVWFNPNTVKMAGGNDLGQLGINSTATVTTVQTVNFSTGLAGETLKDVGIYAKTAYALTESGKVFLWGDNSAKQVGNNAAGASVNAPVNITASFGLTGTEKVVSMSTGVNHAVAITSAYKIFFWGTNSNYAIGDGLALNAIKSTPFNVSATFNYSSGLGQVYSGDFYVEYQQPVAVSAGNDSTIFVSIYGESYDGGPIEYYEWEYLQVVGLNNYENQNYVLGRYTEGVPYLPKLKYISWVEYYDGNFKSLSHSRTNLFVLNTDGDFTMFGSNLYGQHGLGYTSDGGDEDNTNFSNNVRYFMDSVYDYLPTNLTAPIDEFFYPGNTFLSDPYYAIYGWAYGSEDYQRVAGLLDYFFPDSYPNGELFTEREWSVFTPEQLTFMRQIIATLFEDEVLHESYIRTDEFIYDEVYDNREYAKWVREDMTMYVNYGSYDMSYYEIVYLDDATQALLPAAVETRLDQYREMLENIENFEQDYLEDFVETMIDLQAGLDDEFEFYYYDDYYYENVLSLGNRDIEYLIANGYEDDILAIFDAHDELSELEQLLISEYHYWEIYEELFTEYYEYFADDYDDELYDFMYDVQDGDWHWYWPLFENLEALEALLNKINTLPNLSYEMFVEMYEDFWGDEYYNYETYEYWIHLNSLLPLLQEGHPVYLLIANIENNLLKYDDEEGYTYIDAADAASIFAMYNAFLELSEDAQDLLDPEYIYWLYSLALEAVAYEAQSLLWNVYDYESESGYYGLFANYDDVLAALATFEALPEDALEYLDEDAIAYYYYLLDLKLLLEEGLDVYGQIREIEEMDLENLDDATIEAIGAMYANYLALSEEARALLDPDYVDFLTNLAVTFVQDKINELPGSIEDFESLFNDNETKAGAISNLLAAWNAYQALTPELRELLDPAYVAALEAIYARYLELLRPTVDLAMIGLIIVHLFAGAYFAFKKRDILVPAVKA
jgi:alpha-tubulin suppressor-like RCC1 family protein